MSEKPFVEDVPGKEEDIQQQQYVEEEVPKRNSYLFYLSRLGLGDQFTRSGTIVLTLLVITLFLIFGTSLFSEDSSLFQARQVEPTPYTGDFVLPEAVDLPVSIGGVARMVNTHTVIPDRPRDVIETYTVVKGDTVIGIAEKYNLKPETIMFGNYYLLRDDPHNLSIGAELNILPVDGYYYEWQVGDGLNGVASGLNVTPQDIINYPLNNLDPVTIGDYSNPNIEPGTWLIIPGGTRPYSSWTAPVGVTRDDPAVARVMGTGACGEITGGAIGLGYFVWPADKHYLSGFDYSVETNHRGIDIAGNTGEPIYAVDAGVIVYSGWNSWGYGNMVMIDHGNGWQSLYAHMNSIDVVCGQSVDMGWIIGTIGNTGNSSGSHLHFELMHTLYSKVNPWSYLPPP